MRVLRPEDVVWSFDVGVKNMGVAVLNANGTVRSLSVLTIVSRVNRVVDTVRTLREFAEGHSHVLPDVVLVEKQLHRNPTMRVVQAILQTYFHLQHAKAHVLEYSPKKKLSSEKIPDYRKRKKRSVELCVQYLSRTDPEGAPTRAFLSLKKKDDAADALLQALRYLDVPVEPSAYGFDDAEEPVPA